MSYVTALCDCMSQEIINLIKIVFLDIRFSVSPYNVEHDVGKYSNFFRKPFFSNFG